MPSINLIASHREEKRRYEQHVRRLAYALAGEVGAILLVTSVLALRLTTVRGNVQQLNGQIAKLEPNVNSILKLQAETAALQPRVTALNEARNNTLYWYTAMQSVVACLPQESWLTSVTSSGDPAPPAPAPTTSSSSSTPAPAPAATAPPTLTLAGMAATSNDVGAAMVKMNQYANIASVSLGSLQQSSASGQGQGAMQFNMTVAFKPNTAQDVTTPGFPAVPTPAAAKTAASTSAAYPDKAAKIASAGVPPESIQPSQESSHV